MHNLNSGCRYRRGPRTHPIPGRSRDIFSLGSGTASPPRRATSAEAVVETPRLVLRRPRAADFEAYAELCADPEMAVFSGKGPSGPDEAWMRLLRHVGHWSLLGYGFFVVEEKATGRLIGEVGLGDFRRELGPAFDAGTEAGWAIARALQGRGYATEAATAALAWIEARFEVPRTVCIIHADNVASIRVAEKLGYRPLGQCTYRDYPALTFERSRP